MHFVSANLKFNNLFIFGDDGGVERLITVLFRHGNVIFDAAAHRHVEGMNDAKGEVAIGNVIDDNTKGGEIVNFAHILVVLSKFFMKRINGLNTTRDLEFDFFTTEGLRNFFLDFLHSFLGGNIISFDYI